MLLIINYIEEAKTVINIDILVGSTLGATEYVAEATQPFLDKAGFNNQVHFNPNFSNLDLQENNIWLICLATHGAGDYPDNFKLFVEQISQTKINLCYLRYGLIGVGDSNYDSFCFAANKFDALLQSCGAKRVGKVFNIDIVDHLIPEDCITDWIPLWIEDLKLSMK